MSSFFFNNTATTEIYTLSLHDALPISTGASGEPTVGAGGAGSVRALGAAGAGSTVALCGGGVAGRSHEATMTGSSCRTGVQVVVRSSAWAAASFARVGAGPVVGAGWASVAARSGSASAAVG